MYIVIELQTNNEGEVGNIVTAYRDKNAAESKYHQILSAAATSDVPLHAACILNERGEAERNEFYKHFSVSAESEE